MPVSRTVTLVLVGADGVVLGALPAFDVERPFWQETEEVVAAARERFGVDVVVLRILSAERPQPHGGAVTYLAQTDQRPPVEPIDITLTEQPKRLPYAEVNGPAKSLRWAAAALPAPILRATQLRTWNLSTIWRLDTAAGPVWLKQVPPFFAHEAAVLRWVARHWCPRCSPPTTAGCCWPTSPAPIFTAPTWPRAPRSRPVSTPCRPRRPRTSNSL